MFTLFLKCSTAPRRLLVSVTSAFHHMDPCPITSQGKERVEDLSLLLATICSAKACLKSSELALVAMAGNDWKECISTPYLEPF